MKFLIVLYTLIAYCCMHRSHLQDKHLQIYFMSDFRNDSIFITTGKSNSKNIRVTTDNSIGASFTNLIFMMREGDNVITVKNLSTNVTDSIKYTSEHKYLYVFYQQKRFSFEFSNKLLSFE